MEWVHQLKAILQKVYWILVYRSKGIQYEGSIKDIWNISDERKNFRNKHTIIRDKHTINNEMQSTALLRSKKASQFTLVFNKDQPVLFTTGTLPKGWLTILSEINQRHRESHYIHHENKTFRKLFGVFGGDAITFELNEPLRLYKRELLQRMIKGTETMIIQRVDTPNVNEFLESLLTGKVSEKSIDQFIRECIYPCWFGSWPASNLNTDDSQCHELLSKIILDEELYTGTTFLHELRGSSLTHKQNMALCFEICRAVGNLTDVLATCLNIGNGQQSIEAQTKPMLLDKCQNSNQIGSMIHHAYLTKPPEKEIARVMPFTKSYQGITIVKGTTVLIPVKAYNRCRIGADMSFGFGIKQCPARAPALKILASIMSLLNDAG